MDTTAVHAEGRAASVRLVTELTASRDPVLAYKASLLAGLDPGSPQG